MRRIHTSNEQATLRVKQFLLEDPASKSLVVSDFVDESCSCRNGRCCCCCCCSCSAAARHVVVVVVQTRFLGGGGGGRIGITAVLLVVIVVFLLFLHRLLPLGLAGPAHGSPPLHPLPLPPISLDLHPGLPGQARDLLVPERNLVSPCSLYRPRGVGTWTGV